MGNCCDNKLNKIFCNVFNKYYNTLYASGEISRTETNNLLIIAYLRQLMLNPMFSNYTNVFLKALRCIADRSCLLDSSWLYNRSIVPSIYSSYVVVKQLSNNNQGDWTFDTVPTEGSNNPVTSDGIYRYIETNNDTLNRRIRNVADIMVTASYDSGNHAYALDMSYADMSARLNDDLEGSNIFVLLYTSANHTIKLQFTSYDSNENIIVFSCVDRNINGITTYYELTYTDDEFAELLAMPIVTPIIQVSGTSVTQDLSPFGFYKFTEPLTSLTVTLLLPVNGVAYTYGGKFTADTGFNMTILDNVLVANGSDTPADGDICEFSILDNVIVVRKVGAAS